MQNRTATPTQPAGVRLLRPFQRFAAYEASEGLLLILAVVAALAWANSPWGESYDSFWHTQVSLSVAGQSFSIDLLHVVDDGLMALFFLLVGLEIKRELLVGELASRRSAALPLFGAIGGMVVPALLYLAFNWGTETARGWAIPMATDIAFAAGVLSLLRNHVQPALAVFLVALAIVDDIGAIAVIAVYYSGGVELVPLLSAAAGVGLLTLMNLLHVRSLLLYGLVGLGLWAALFYSGVHATLAGVLLALAIPARPRRSPDSFVIESRSMLDAFTRAGGETPCVLCNEDQQEIAREIDRSSAEVRPVLTILEDRLHPWVVYAIMPVFALANAGIRIDTELLSRLGEPVALGIMVGLVLGKQGGILLLSRLSVALGLAELERGSWRRLYSVAWLAGIGFTVSIFIATLTFENTDTLPLSKLAVLIASVLSGIVGSLLIRALSPETAGEADDENDNPPPE